MNTGVLDELVSALRCLPSVGPKSAQRMAFHLLQRDRAGADRLARALGDALTRLHNCARCNTFTELEVCERCSSPRRDASQLCVVETPADMLMMEQTHSYSGLYFCLMGRIAPLEGVGPKELRLDRLLERAADPAVREVILATNFTNEGRSSWRSTPTRSSNATRCAASRRTSPILPSGPSPATRASGTSAIC